MATMNLSLPAEMKRWAEERASATGHANVSAYIRDLIERDHRREMARAELQGAISAGLESGPARPADRETKKRDARRQAQPKP